MENIIGQKFGRLTVVERKGSNKHRHRVWLCKCDCGNRLYTTSHHLLSGGSTSCGCVRTAKMINGMRKECVEQTYLSLLNKKKSKSNTSGVKGVYWKKDKNMWDVKIGFQKKEIHIGYFKDFEDAVKARKRAEEQYFEPMLNKYGKELL